MTRCLLLSGAALVATILFVSAPVAAPKVAPRAATLYLRGGGEAIKAVEAVLREALGARAGVTFRRLETLMEPSTSKTTAAKKALLRVSAAEESLTKRTAKEALVELLDSVSELERHFDVVGAGVQFRAGYVQALGTLSKAYFLMGKREDARRVLSWAVSMDSEFSHDAGRFPKKMKGLFETAHFLAQELGAKKAEIRADPEDAEIWIDGHPKGRSPLLVDLPRGRHLVALRRLGYTSKTVSLELDSDDEVQRMRVKLTPLEGQPLVRLDRALEEARLGRAQAAQQRALELLGVQLIVFGQVVATKAGSFLELYAVGQERGAGRARGRLASPAAAESVLAALFAVPKSGEELPPSGPGFFARMTRSRYFWPVVIGVAGAAAVATVVVATSESTDSRRRLVPILPLLGF
ncbi:MAG: PEGA domain-containing protein [Deltaproteobacteria bacterium]|nr:PEGA domain-containing protein [Deltaproteobacteria bacterium]